MAGNSRNFLAQQVSYRNLSRELKVHSNVAKRLLFQFHKQQNSKKPGSVHAVYLVTGYISPVTPTSSAQYEQADGEDVHMQSSPFMSSSMPRQDEDEEQLAVKTVTLCREEYLEDVKTRSRGKVSIHVYSLGPSTIQNIQLLSECNRTVITKHAMEDPLQAGRQYGTIQNARVKRRTGPRPLPAQSTAAATKASHPPKASTPAVKTETQPNPARETKALPAKTASRSEAKPKDETPQQSSQQKKPATKTPGLKRDKSDIFKSFAKAPSKISRENTASSAGASPAPKAETPAPEEVPDATQDPDESMNEASDGEQLEDSLISAEKAAQSKRGTRSEREDQLKKLLDDDDDNEAETDHTSPNQETPPISPPHKTSEQPENPPPAAAPRGGRRRGRRQVMKKKTIKDEEGYLVTKEEPGWESFSEDEPAPKEAVTAAPVSTAPSTSKVKKAAGKPGQGNIMSFFGKK
ncbi:CDC27 protein [Xanthoria parietina]